MRVFGVAVSAWLGVSAIAAPSFAINAPYLVEDFKPGSQSLVVSSDPWSPVAIGNFIVFSAESKNGGREPYSLDQRDLTVRILIDACPGPCASISSGIVRAAQRAFWLASPGGGSLPDLWSSDGTSQGTTVLARGVRPLPQSPSPDSSIQSGLLVVGNRVLYARDTGEQGSELWFFDAVSGESGQLADMAPGEDGTSLLFSGAGAKSAFFLESQFFTVSHLWVTDGTPNGTRDLAELGSTSFRELAVSAHKAFFEVFSDAAWRLFASDGTPGGSGYVTDPSISFPPPQDRIRVVADRAYFFAQDDVHGEELWTSDGTRQGTRQFSDFAAAAPFSFQAAGPPSDSLAVVGEKVFLFASDDLGSIRLWTANGMPKGTVPVLDPCVDGCTRAPGWIVGLPDRAVYLRTAGAEDLWSSDGTPEHTQRVANLCPDECAPLSGPRVLDGRVYFGISTVSGPAYWTSNGRSDGTSAFLRSQAASQPSNLGFLLEVAAGSLGVFLGADDGIHGMEPYWMPLDDGPPSLLADLGNSAANSEFSRSVPVGPGVILSTCDAAPNTTWYTNGVPNTVEQIAEPLVSSLCADRGISIGDRALFEVQGALWASDGSPEDTHEIFDFRQQGAVILAMLRFGESSRILTQTGQKYAIWESNGTAIGTVKRYELPEITFPVGIDRIGDSLYIVGLRANTDWNIWRVDDSSGQQVQITAHGAAHSAPASQIVVELGSGAVVAAAIDDFRPALWKTEGLPADAVRIAPPEGSLASVTALASLDPRLVYVQENSDRTVELRSSLGVPGDSIRLAGPFPGNNLSSLWGRQALARAGDRIFVALPAESPEVTLWVTDGTIGGTLEIPTPHLGLSSNAFPDLVATGERIIYSAWTPDGGTEPWTSDGTQSGTIRVGDIAPGEASSSPENFVVARDHLFFSADDGQHGRELWAIDLTPGAPSCAPSSTALCLNGGRFRVQSVWRDFQGNSGEGTAVSLTPDSGYFWFFDSANVEALLKVLDGTGVNGHHWVFYGALSNVEYTFDVTDTVDGSTRRYFNPPGRYASVGDIEAFGPHGAHSGLTSDYVPAADSISGRFDLEDSKIAASGSCVPSPTTLCLRDGQFAVSIAWTDFQGNHGSATTVPFSNDTGLFWFFNPENIEMALKVLDGRPINGKFWVYYGALSNVEFHVTVTDTLTGHVKTYTNPAGVHASVGDVDAF